LTTEVENFPGFPEGVNGPELMIRMREQATRYGTRVVTEDIVDIDLKKWPFEMTDSVGTKLTASSVIIATGASANYLGLESEGKFKNMGVSACAVCDGALPRFRNKPLIVVGGGDSAAEEGSYLTKFASKVHLVHRRDSLRASQVMAQRILSNPKVEPVWNSVVEEVLGDETNGMTGVRVKNNKSGEKVELPAGGLFLAIGHTPNTAFLGGQVETHPTGYIKWTTLARTYTSVEGVFAAGDVADDYYRQAVSAAGTGCMAALDAERYLGHHGLI
jgi:thioredoxin reductase (NADPH)